MSPNLEEEYFVFYGDLLGIGNLFRNDRCDIEKGYNIIESFKSILHDNWFKKLKEDGHNIPQTEFFSDSVLVYSPLNGDENLDRVQHTLAGLVMAFTKVLAPEQSDDFKEPFTFRGAIEIGEARQIGTGKTRGLIGPAIQNAYYLENKIAKYPRIVIGPKLVNKIQDEPNIKKWISKDMDGIWQLNIFCKAHAELLANLGMDIKGFFTKIGKNINKQYDIYERQDKLEFASKWGYLLQYLRQSDIGEKYLKEFFCG